MFEWWKFKSSGWNYRSCWSELGQLLHPKIPKTASFDHISSPVISRLYMKPLFSAYAWRREKTTNHLYYNTYIYVVYIYIQYVVYKLTHTSPQKKNRNLPKVLHDAIGGQTSLLIHKFFESCLKMILAIEGDDKSILPRPAQLHYSFP